MNHKSELEIARSIAYFDQVNRAYQEVENCCETVVKYYFQIAKSIVCLRFAGNALVQSFTRAITHLEVEPVDDPNLTICLTSSQDTSMPRPVFIWQDHHYHRRGEVYGFVNDRIYTAKQWDSAALVMVNYDRNLAIYWVEDDELIPYWEKAAPLQVIFNVWLSRRQVQLVHGAAIGSPDGAVLLVGKGGSGKSTTALSCLNSDLMYVSDDYCLITPEPAPTVFSIYNTGKKNVDDLDRLPFLRSQMSNPDRLDREKAVYFIHERFPTKILRSAPLKATLIPRVTGRETTTLESTIPENGISALIPNTIMQLGGAGKMACDLMQQTLSQLPCYYLNVGTNILQISSVIQQFIQQEI